MKPSALPVVWLRVRLCLVAFEPVACVALALCLTGAVVLFWALEQRQSEAMRNRLPPSVAAISEAHSVPRRPAEANANLAQFYSSLGDKRHVEQQVKTLFGLAEKTGLTLQQGEYKQSYEKNAKVWTYQVVLPVKGSYPAIWRFAFLSMRALPFASLDAVSFKRNGIGEVNVEARLGLTLYLAAQQGLLE